MDLFGGRGCIQKIKQIFTYDQLDTEPQQPKDLHLDDTVHRVLASIGGLWRGRPRITPVDAIGVSFGGFLGAGLRLVDVKRINCPGVIEFQEAVNPGRYLSFVIYFPAGPGQACTIVVDNTDTGQTSLAPFIPTASRLWQYMYAYEFEFNRVTMDVQGSNTDYQGGVEVWNIIPK